MLTQEVVIGRFIKAHGDRYSYDLVDYRGSDIKVKIICYEHGVFEQKPTHHTRGQGCPLCKHALKTSNTHDFIIKAVLKHGDKYDYKNVIYVKSNQKVHIICSEHGSFWQTPNSHLRGTGCNDCGREVTRKSHLSNTADFSRKSSIVHHGKYDYELTKYINNRLKVEIICPHHGLFKQSPSDHLSGKGCVKCGIIKLSLLFSGNLTDFVNSAKQKHGNKYLYTLSEYINAYTKIEIICNKHGSFWQRPYSHLIGAGCSKCAYEQQSLYQLSDTPTFVTKGELKHEGLYTYNHSVYINSRTPIEITCREHGSFWQKPNHHLNGNGCPTCYMSNGAMIVRQYLIGMGVTFKIEKRYTDCRGDSNPLSFDFHLPENNVLIEYDGIQHFMYTPFLHNYEYENFLQGQKYDEIKNQYCLDNDIPLIRIKYDVENIGEYLENALTRIINTQSL